VLAFIARGSFSHDLLPASLLFILVKIADPLRLSSGHQFTFTNKLYRDDALLLAFDALVLSEMLCCDVTCGKIVHGDDHATRTVKTAALADKVRKIIGKIATLLASHSPPDLVLNRHCVECEFRDRCRQRAIEQDDLSLLSNMTDKERRKFNSKGIFTVKQLSYTFRARRRPKRLSGKREKYHHSLKALAIRELKIHIVGSPELKIEGTPVYLDVEGIPDREFYYLIGIRVKIAEQVIQHSLGTARVATEYQHAAQQLEESLGVPLFTRTTRRLLLTDTQGCTVSPKFAVRQGNDFPNNVIDVRALP
jgi:predicted RecB family nuclease